MTRLEIVLGLAWGLFLTACAIRQGRATEAARKAVAQAEIRASTAEARALLARASAFVEICIENGEEQTATSGDPTELANDIAAFLKRDLAA